MTVEHYFQNIINRMRPIWTNSIAPGVHRLTWTCERRNFPYNKQATVSFDTIELHVPLCTRVTREGGGHAMFLEDNKPREDGNTL